MEAPLRFEILLDHDANTMTHRYSLDAGTSWHTPLGALDVAAGAYGASFAATDVPAPPVLLCLVAALPWLWRAGRARPQSSQA